MTEYIIGVDFGGTNLDLVAVDNNKNIIAKQKVPKKSEVDLISIFYQGVQKLLKQGLNPRNCLRVHVGTTVGLNALLTRKNLLPTGVIRLCPNKILATPGMQLPHDLRHSIIKGVEHVMGGFYMDERAVRDLDKANIEKAAAKLINNGAQALVIIGVFAPLYQQQELLVQSILNELYPTIPITLSYQLGGLGFLDRETNAILNASLLKIFATHDQDLTGCLKSLGIKAQLAFCHNNGTRVTVQHAMQLPIFTLLSGPTNSLIGAAKLAKLSDALVMDCGGTSTDLGLVKESRPILRPYGAKFAGVKTSLITPQVLSMALGGGTVFESNAKKYTLYEALSQNLEDSIRKLAEQQLIAAIQMLGPVKNCNIIMVGGSASLFEQFCKNHNILRPEHYEVANAYGAALAPASATIDRIMNIENSEAVLALEFEAMQAAVANGADPCQVRIVEKQFIPIYYTLKPMGRYVITAL